MSEKIKIAEQSGSGLVNPKKEIPPDEGLENKRREILDALRGVYNLPIVRKRKRYASIISEIPSRNSLPENFLADEGNSPTPLAQQNCWFCHEVPIPPLRLVVGRHSIVLNQDTLIYPHHLDANRRNDYSEVWAEMVPHPKKPDVWGLKNISGQTWTTVPPSGGPNVEVASGRSVSLVPGLRIRFPTSEGTVA